MVAMVMPVTEAIPGAGASSRVRSGWTKASRMRQEDAA
jgi:hypothetical protein